jgi:hypothetical protein
MGAHSRYVFGDHSHPLRIERGGKRGRSYFRFSRLALNKSIAGTYGATSASLAIVGGAKVATLKNEKGVALQVHGVQLGLEASLSLSGVTIALQP